MPTLLLSLGANLGHRAATLATACDLLSLMLGSRLVVSDFYESEPMGFASDHRFLNCAARLECSAQPADVLAVCCHVERLLGRTQKSHNGQHTDRPVDIDLLAYGDTVMQTPDLTLPHPRMGKRSFVLLPLAEIAGDLRHPTTGLTYDEMAARCTQGEATRIGGSAPQLCRRLTEADATPHTTEGLNRLLAQLSSRRLAWQPDSLRALLRHDALRLLVLTDAKGDLIGTASLLVTPQLTGLKSHLEDVVVDTAWRGKGLGARLVANALAHAAREGIGSLELTSRPEREAANALYRKMGFAPRPTNVYRITGEALTRWASAAGALTSAATGKTSTTIEISGTTIEKTGTTLVKTGSPTG